MEAVFFGLMAFTFGSGLYFLLKEKGGRLFAAAGTLALPVSAAALIAFISVYFYELGPTLKST
jgi:hypothetical protein